MNIRKVKDIAREAGREVLKFYTKQNSVSYKTADKSSPLTEADLTAHGIIKKGLKEYGFPILSEEAIGDEYRLDGEYVWIVDPLDGTSDFIEKTGEFSIMIGLAWKGRAILGVVYEPIAERFYFAENGKGSFKEEKGIIEKIKVSEKQNFDEMKILISRNHLLEKEIRLSEKLKLKKIVCGSAGLKICKIASGEAEIYLNSSDRMGLWDTCAASIILREAGGEMTDMLGRKILYNPKNISHKFGILATHKQRHQEIVEELGVL